MPPPRFAMAALPAAALPPRHHDADVPLGSTHAQHARRVTLHVAASFP